MREANRGMSILTRSLAPFLAGLLALIGCDKPPADAYVGGVSGGPALDLGRNTANEACSLQQGTPNEIFCGAYLEPAGRVDTASASDEPMTFLSGSPWRKSFDSRFL